jgi:hypothetical protein
MNLFTADSALLTADSAILTADAAPVTADSVLWTADAVLLTADGYYADGPPEPVFIMPPASRVLVVKRENRTLTVRA